MKKAGRRVCGVVRENQGRTIHDRPTLQPTLGALMTVVIGLGSQDPNGDLTADRPLPIVY